MMPEKKVRMQDTDGVEWVVNLEWLKQNMGICKLEKLLTDHIRWAGAQNCQPQRDILFQQIDRLTKDIIDVETPRMKLKILSLLTDNPDMRTRQITEKTPWKNQILWGAFNKAFKDLQDEGAIIGTSHGAGHNRTWRIADHEL